MPRIDPKVKRFQVSQDAEQWSGNLNLLIAGFSKQTIISIPEIAKAIEILPDHHLENLHVVRYDPRKMYLKMEYYITNEVPNLNNAGIYDPSMRGIAIFDFKNKRDFYETLYHEIGHFVYYHVIGHNNKHHWVTQINYKSPLVSEYAKTNASESFAETYRVFVLQPNFLRENPLKYNYFYNTVFKNFQPKISELAYR